MKTANLYVLCICFTTTAVSASQVPSAKELLQRYTESQEKFKSFVLKYDCEYTGSHRFPHRGMQRVNNGKGDISVSSVQTAREVFF